MMGMTAVSITTKSSEQAMGSPARSYTVRVEKPAGRPHSLPSPSSVLSPLADEHVAMKRSEPASHGAPYLSRHAHNTWRAHNTHTASLRFSGALLG